MVQQRLCKKVSPRSIHFSVAFEEGVNQRKAFEGASWVKEVKQEPMWNNNRIPCMRCGLEMTQNVVAGFIAKNEDANVAQR